MYIYTYIHAYMCIYTCIYVHSYSLTKRPISKTLVKGKEDNECHLVEILTTTFPKLLFLQQTFLKM